MNPNSHVMVVADDADRLQRLESILESQGFRVTGALGGFLALEKLGEGDRPCLILFDLEQSFTSVADFKRALLRDPGLRDTPVIVTATSGTNLELFESSLKRLEKPFSLNTLMQAVEEHCGGGRGAYRGQQYWRSSLAGLACPVLRWNLLFGPVQLHGCRWPAERCRYHALRVCDRNEDGKQRAQHLSQRVVGRKLREQRRFSPRVLDLRVRDKQQRDGGLIHFAAARHLSPWLGLECW